MKKAFTQIRDVAKVKRRFLAIKKVIIQKYLKEHIIDTWFNHSSINAIGYEFDFPHNY